jgi:hypothetical protein
MSNLIEVPLRRRLKAADHSPPYVVLPLGVRGQDDNPKNILFSVETIEHACLLHVNLLETFKIPVTLHPILDVPDTYTGIIHITIQGTSIPEFPVVCHFLGNPNLPTDNYLAPQGIVSLWLLLRKVRVTFDGSPTRSFPFGVMRIHY